MNRRVKTAVLAIASIAAVSVPLSTASADSWWGYERRSGWIDNGWGPRPFDYPRRYHRNRSGDAVAAGVLGLAAGALIGGALSQPARPVYVQPAPIYTPPPPAYYPAPRRAAAYRVAYEPWSQSWYQYCSNRYRSFNPNTGTYRGYDGRDHFCSAN